MGLADDLAYADGQEIGALWREDEGLLNDDLEEDPIAILSAADDADALAYLYEDALELDAPQLEAWAGIEAGVYADAGTIWTRRLSVTAQIAGLVLLLAISAVSAFVLSN